MKLTGLADVGTRSNGTSVLELSLARSSMTHKFLAKNSRLPKYPPPPSNVMKGRQLTDVSRRRFDVSQSPVQLQGSPDFGRLRDSSSPLSSPPPSFLRSPSFQLLRSHPFSSVNEPMERKGERMVEQRESKLRPVPGHFLSLSLSHSCARVFSSSFSVFSLPFPFLFLFSSPLPPSNNADFSPQSEK